MAFPTKNELLVGIGFVFFGILMAVCDRWLIKTKAKGSDSDKGHIFDHLFLMWTVKQLLQLFLLLVHLFIDKNWFGCGRFRHGDAIQRAHPYGGELKLPRYHDNDGLVNDNEGDQDGNGHDQDEDQGSGTQLIQDNGAVENQDNNGEGQAEMKDVLQDVREKKLKNKRKGPLIFIYLVPAFFAQADVLLVYFGLQITYSSSFMMLKGTVTFFTALLAMAFLAQQLAGYVWFGVIVAGLGFAVSGINDYVHIPPVGFENYGIAAGDLMIVMAQIMFAAKIIYEEKYIRKYSVHPMMFLGCEAIYGLCFAFVFLLVSCLVEAPQYTQLPGEKLEDVYDALQQFVNSWRIRLAFFGSLICYILYTYLGLFLIRDQGALPRIMIETFVWLIYWAMCLGFEWDRFFIAHVPGLCIISIGVLIYSHILVLPFSSRLDGLKGNINDNLQDQLFPNKKLQNEPPQEQQGRDGEVNQNFQAEEHDGAQKRDQEDEDLQNGRIVAQVHQPQEEYPQRRENPNNVNIVQVYEENPKNVNVVQVHEENPNNVNVHGDELIQA